MSRGRGDHTAATGCPLHTASFLSGYQCSECKINFYLVPQNFKNCEQQGPLAPHPRWTDRGCPTYSFVPRGLGDVCARRLPRPTGVPGGIVSDQKSEVMLSVPWLPRSPKHKSAVKSGLEPFPSSDSHGLLFLLTSSSFQYYTSAPKPQPQLCLTLTHTYAAMFLPRELYPGLNQHMVSVTARSTGMGLRRSSRLCPGLQRAKALLPLRSLLLPF